MKTLSLVLVLGSVVDNSDGTAKHVRLDLKEPRKDVASAHIALLLPAEEAKDFQPGEYSISLYQTKVADKTGPVAEEAPAEEAKPAKAKKE